MKKWLIIFFAILIVAPTAKAATIYGSVYDESLKPLKNAIIEINTVPPQKVIAKDATYSIDAAEGSYLLTAKYIEKESVKLYAEEKIEIKNEGKFVIDLILVPYLEENPFEEPLNLGEIDFGEQEAINIPSIILIILAILTTAILLIKIIFKGKKKQQAKDEQSTLDTEAEKVISAIKNLGGRTTQKEIRKALHFSEAKISLIIAELEHKGKITKIKKGRGNIIILN